jgi:hypothetical protein
MVVELRNYHAQVHAYGFEIERIDKNIKTCKEEYFAMLRH